MPQPTGEIAYVFHGIIGWQYAMYSNGASDRRILRQVLHNSRR